MISYKMKPSTYKNLVTNISFNTFNRKYCNNSFPTQAQVVIAGAGVVANSVAYHLVKNGWKDIVILEQNAIGSGTSHFGSGVLGLFKPISHRNVIMYSLKLYKELQKEGFDIGLRQVGSINLAQTEDRLIALKRRIAYNIPTGTWNIMWYKENKFVLLYILAGLHCEMITEKEIKRLHPYLYTNDILGAVWVPEDAVADCKAVCDTLALLASAGGAKYYEYTSVKRILTKNSRVYGVETSKGNITCEYFVNCAGMWARELGLSSDPKVQIPAYPAEHYYATTGFLSEGMLITC